jgi:hypothetical protein
LLAIVVEETAQAKGQWWCWTAAEGHKMAKGAKKAREARMQRAYKGKRNPRPCSYTPMEVQRTDEKVGAVFSFNDLT